MKPLGSDVTMTVEEETVIAENSIAAFLADFPRPANCSR